MSVEENKAIVRRHTEEWLKQSTRERLSTDRAPGAGRSCQQNLVTGPTATKARRRGTAIQYVGNCTSKTSFRQMRLARGVLPRSPLC